MTHFSITTDIPAPPERVWAVITDVEKWSEWTASVTSIRLMDPGPLAPGSRMLIRQPKLPPALWMVEEVVERRSFTSTSTAPGVKVTARHSIEPVGEGSRVTLSVSFSGFLASITGRLTRTINETYLKLEAEGLARRCSAG